jgi:hypothetical protein
LQITANNAITATDWYHIGVVQNGNTMRLYVNGQLLSSGSAEQLPPLDGDFTVQNSAGLIDDLRVYTGSLNQAQMLSVYHQLND